MLNKINLKKCLYSHRDSQKMALSVILLTQHSLLLTIHFIEQWNKTSKYALTGAAHTNNMYLFEEACMRVRAGNFYNTMTTGAYIGKQPFSGDRKSGTNSKVGGPWNLLNWVSIQSLSFSFKPPLFLPMYLS